MKRAALIINVQRLFNCDFSYYDGIILLNHEEI